MSPCIRVESGIVDFELMPVKRLDQHDHLDAVSRPLLLCVLIGLLLISLRYLSPVLVPILQAGFLTLVAAKPVVFLRQRKFPHSLAVLTVVFWLTATIVALVSLVGSAIADLGSRAPVYEQQLDRLTGAWASRLERWDIEVPVGSIDRMLDPGTVLGYVAVAAQQVGVTFVHLVFVMLLVSFALMELPLQLPKLQAVSGRMTVDLDRVKSIVSDIDRYVLIKTWIGLGTGIAAGTLVALIGVDHALLWGLVTFLLNYIPNVGSIVAAVPPIVLAFLEMGPWPALFVLLAYIAVNVGFANILEPRFLGKGLGMSPVTILVSLLLWGWVFGATGVFLAVPIGIALRSSLERSEDTGWIAVVVGLRRLDARPPARAAPSEEEPDATKVG